MGGKKVAWEGRRMVINLIFCQQNVIQAHVGNFKRYKEKKKDIPEVFLPAIFFPNASIPYGPGKGEKVPPQDEFCILFFHFKCSNILPSFIMAIITNEFVFSVVVVVVIFLG